MSWVSEQLEKAGVWWRGRKVLPTVEKSVVLKTVEATVTTAVTSEAATLAEQEAEKL